METARFLKTGSMLGRMRLQIYSGADSPIPAPADEHNVQIHCVLQSVRNDDKPPGNPAAQGTILLPRQFHPDFHSNGYVYRHPEILFLIFPPAAIVPV